jgi:peptidoglycan-N-acetylglucosamine deacetylase
MQRLYIAAFFYIRLNKPAMNFYWIKTSFLIKKIFPKFIWDIPNDENKIYLTFDDGPTPKITPWVLDELKKHHIKATFFCIGNNILDYPDIFQRIIAEGHSVGNHTFSHLKGWDTATGEYIQNIQACGAEIQKYNSGGNRLFRPPYGKISRSQTGKVLQMGFRIIMWDILTVDYDKNVSPEKCLNNATQKTQSGSIIIFHDSIKAFPNLEYALPKTIEILKNKGFKFDTIR